METTDGTDVQEATVELYRQTAMVRAQNPDELIEDYIQFLDEQGRTVASTVQVTPANMGSVSFEDLPIVDDTTEATLLYTLQVSEATTEVRDQADPTMTRTVNFGDSVLPNLVAEAGDAVTVHEIPLTPLAGFEVNSTGDAPDTNVEDGVCDTGTTIADGTSECTLRAAIEQANAKAGADLISFNIPGPAPHTITPLSKLPAITDPVIIDGDTQPATVPGDITAIAVADAQQEHGAHARLGLLRVAVGSVGTKKGTPANPKIILDGKSAGRAHGYVVKAKKVRINGKRIVNFQRNGIKLTKKSGNCRITGNIIGIGQDGTAQGNNNGIVIQSANNTIGGRTQVPGKAPGNVLSGNLSDGVLITGTIARGNTMVGNLIGLDPSGTKAVGNVVGVAMSDAPSNVIGGTQTGAGNVISGNRSTFEGGVSIVGTAATGNTVVGNVIGLDKSGTKSVRNGVGVSITDGASNVIGGVQAGAGNVISGNFFDGVTIAATGTNDAKGNTVIGNVIGLDMSGTKSTGNFSFGVSIWNASGTVIKANDISGNSKSGVLIGGRSAKGTIVQGNRIGETATGLAIPNGDFGVWIVELAKRNTIGGPNLTDRNTIITNNKSGIVVETGNRNSILSNTIRITNKQSAKAIGIDLGKDGATANDAGDADTGPNKLQNFPGLFTATETVGIGDDVEIAGQLNSVASQSYTVQFFKCDRTSSMFTFIGSTTVTTDAQGNGAVTFMDKTITQKGDFVAATATDAKGNTSEFSAPCLEVK